MILLDQSQQQAIDNISRLKSKISLLIGGAGAGKSTTIKHLLVKLWGDCNSGITDENTYIAASTGKAAKVVAEHFLNADFNVINQPQTVHRMLKYNPGTGWGYNQFNKIDARLIIVDESSMLGSDLLSRIIDAVNDDCFLVLVGDEHQLMPVDPGSPFFDLINYGDKSMVNRLTFNHRQNMGSLIADSCQKILTGTMPTFGAKGSNTLGGELQDDLFYIEEQEKEEIPGIVAELCKEMWDNKDDFIILSPQKTGVVGVEAMNKYLQSTLNPPDPSKAEIKLGWLVLREGDRVIQTRNNYELDVYNGFTGTVKSITRDPFEDDKTVITIDFDGQEVEYRDQKHIKDLSLGFTITGHKSQGSQWQKGVIIIHSSHYYIQSRNLLYTMVSRFRKELHIVGDKKAIKRALSNVVSGDRNTFLKLKLRGEEM